MTLKRAPIFHVILKSNFDFKNVSKIDFPNVLKIDFPNVLKIDFPNDSTRLYSKTSRVIYPLTKHCG